MKPDIEIQEDVMAELQWEPMVNATDIGVSVKDGVVTLSGHVSSYMEKRQAELAAKKVKDVKAVAIDIDVQLSSDDNNNDTEIATAIVDAFSWNTLIPDNKIKVRVENAWVTLEGEVEWNYQKEAAKTAVSTLRGIRGISNAITVKPLLNRVVIKDNIKKALERNASIEANRINIITSDHKVTLKGQVDSWYEKSLIKQAAWASPGVVEVVDEMEVS